MSEPPDADTGDITPAMAQVVVLILKDVERGHDLAPAAFYRQSAVAEALGFDVVRTAESPQVGFASRPA